MNPLSKNSRRRAVTAAALFALAACASPGGEPTQISDPLEGVNRAIFATNLALDTTVIEPAATIYRDILPDPARDSVRNLLRNLESPVLLANDVLQRDIDAAGVTTKRFFINTTLGILGLFDRAADMGLVRRDEDFGQTMGTYGVGPGFYLVLPIIGPSSLRDAAGQFVDYYFDPLNYSTANTDRGNITFLRAGIRGLDARARGIETLDEIERTSIDFYATIRSLYHQRRQSDIRNGSAPSLPKLDLSSDTVDDRVASLES